MIEKERIEHIKTIVDIKDFIESKGIRLKKNGKGWFGLCPFHHDKTPSLSVTPAKNEWHCFGCGKGGDVIRFVELFDQLDFKEAVRKLTIDNGKLEINNAAAKKASQKSSSAVDPSIFKPMPLTAKLIKLFNQVIEFYHTAFAESPEPKVYLNKRGITDNAVFIDYKTGYAGGTLLNVLPDDGDIKKQLKEIGILNSRGREHFTGVLRSLFTILTATPAASTADG